MNMKSKAGFTLVELIVVIAILAILAGVAVPAYSGYMTKAKDAAVVTELDAIKTAAFAANATSATPVTQINVAADGTVKLNGSASAVSLSPYYTGTISVANTSYANGAVWYAASGTIPSGYSAGWNAVQ